MVCLSFQDNELKGLIEALTMCLQQVMAVDDESVTASVAASTEDLTVKNKSFLSRKVFPSLLCKEY